MNPKEDLNKKYLYIYIIIYPHIHTNILNYNTIYDRYDPNIDGLVVDEIECLSMLLDPAYTKLTDPNWLELCNYINFFNTLLAQLTRKSRHA